MGRDEIAARDAFAWIADNDGIGKKELSLRLGRNGAYVSSVINRGYAVGTDLTADAAEEAGGELVLTRDGDEIVVKSVSRERRLDEA